MISAQEFTDLMPDGSLLGSEEPEMESSLHYLQALILVTCLEWLWRGRDDFFIGANLTVYFSRQQIRNRDFRGPDFFLVKNTPRQPRRSWVVWEEDGKYPDLIIELLSESTAVTDRTTKRELYQNRFRTPEYFWFDPESLEFVGLRLVSGQYQDIPAQPWGLWSEVLDLYLNIFDGQLRFFSDTGELVPTPQEAALRAEELVATTQLQLETTQAQLQQLQAQIDRSATAVGDQPSDQ
jgi:Uma2 family endonuclease